MELSHIAKNTITTGLAISAGAKRTVVVPSHRLEPPTSTPIIGSNNSIITQQIIAGTANPLINSGFMFIMMNIKTKPSAIKINCRLK